MSPSEDGSYPGIGTVDKHNPGLQFSFTVNEHGASICQARFWDLVRQLGMNHCQHDTWPCDLPALPEALTNEGTDVTVGACEGETAVSLLRLAEDESAVVTCWLAGGTVDVRTVAGSRETASRAMDFVRERLPAASRADPDRIPITFWFDNKNRVSALRRMLDVPRWTAIESNYAVETRQELANLMAGFQPAKGGQLLLFHGLAGTGKTFALRAIGSEWRSWCDVDYIIDPDRFLGEARYLIEVLLAAQQDMDMPDFMHDLFPGMPLPKGASGERAGRWRLIVLEDTGELLSADARERTGQGLSRLLNTVDGLIGQGLRTLILVTTNEPVRELHPAVARAGRCAASIEFHPLSPEESSTWLGRDIGQPTTIADLYALREGYRGARPSTELPDEAGIPHREYREV